MKYLNNIELYYSENFSNDIIKISGDDFKHIIKVMRHSATDKIYITNGKGKIFSAEINEIKKDFLTAKVIETYSFKNKLGKVYYCVPKLKSPERFEFALEKCTELGITNFIVFNSKRSVAKGEKIERWNKILISAMKQSLRSYLPKISVKNLNDISLMLGEIIILEQTADKNFSDFVLNKNINSYFIFGPEGGLDIEELNMFNKQNFYCLSENRLRSETAIIKCAAML